MQIESRRLLEAPPAEASRRHANTPRPAFSVYLSRRPDEIREAQRLRYKIFSEELGAALGADTLGIDEDVFDAQCDHLIAREHESLRVVGTYRILPPHAAKELGYYSDSEFDTTRLDSLKPSLVEFGRSCVHPDFRSGPVIMQLWAALAQYMVRHGYQHAIGCASISMRDGGHTAASLFRRLAPSHLAPSECRVFAHNRLPIERLNSDLQVEAPPLVKGYLRVGAYICGEPAWDPDFCTADFPMMLSLSQMSSRYARHFGVA